MQQRVGLARAFATDADILLMDEPFSALDPLIRARLQDELLELQAKLKKTIVFVSHDLDEAAKLGNRIVIMEGGRIVQAGSVADIVMSPADAYVAAFVRHLNPLEALRASAFMTPLSALARADGALVVGPGLHCRLDLDGRLASRAGRCGRGGTRHDAAQGRDGVASARSARARRHRYRRTGRRRRACGRPVPGAAEELSDHTAAVQGRRAGFVIAAQRGTQRTRRRSRPVTHHLARLLRATRDPQ